MLKHVLFASSMMIAVPALAQDMPAQSEDTPVTQAAPQTTEPTAPTAAPVPADPAQDATQQAETMPAQPAPTEAPVQSADAVEEPAPEQAADAGTAATGDQVQEVVSAEFPSYDKDSDGELKAEEFGEWMVALRSASDPSTNAASAEVKTWIGQAFASADADKSESVSQAELTGFLSQGAS